MDGINKIQNKLTSFRKKYYLNLALRGLILTLSLLLFYFLIASLVEYNLWLSSWARLVIFASFLLLTIFCLYRFLKEPITWWIYRKGLGQQESAKLIGAHFPDVSDRLLNLIQLTLVNSNTPLLQAGIAQKSKQFDSLQFDSAIDLTENRKYLKYFLVPVALIIFIFIFNRGILTQSTERIVNFNQEFSPVAPFRFRIQNKELVAFFNEDYTLHLSVEGDALPEAVYLNTNGQKLKLESVAPGEFQLTFEKIQREMKFQLEGSGFLSPTYSLQLINRPELTQLKMLLSFPPYLIRKNETLVNTGNADIPEGTKITWEINTANASIANAGFASDKTTSPLQKIDDQTFTFNKAFHSSDQYWIALENEHSKNKDRINYTIQVAKDQYPEIKVDHLKDSVLYKNVFLGGNVSDDYGITALTLNYEIIGEDKPIAKKIDIRLSGHLAQQSFFYQWHIDSLKLKPGEKINYFLQVWDNDGVNGHKSTKSAVYVFALPGEEALKNEILKSQSAAQSQMDKSLKKAKDLRETIDEAQQKLKGKQMLDWQDKKMLEDLVEQKKNLDQMISDLQKQNKQLEEKKNSFSEQDEKIREKSEQIQKLMNELLDPETKKLFEELEKLLKENSDINQMQKMLDKMNRKEVNLEKELERTLSLFKQMQFDYKLDQAISDLQRQEERQEKLLEETKELAGEKSDRQQEKPGDDKTKDSDNKSQNDKSQSDKSKDGQQKNEKASDKSAESPDCQSLSEKQDDLSKEMDQFQKDFHELDKMAKDLDKDITPPSDEDIKDTKDAQQESKESLSKGNPKKSVPPQKKSLQQMKKMGQQLEGMQESMEMEIDMQNLETLRQILHGLIKLSFDQESLMKDFNQIIQTDPKYIQLSQNQLKIRDDSKVLEDSLLSLAKRDAFMNSIVTKEVGELNMHLDKSAENVRERRKPNASSEMQLSMTSINNLALMLNDHYDMMMDMLKNAMPMPGKGKKGKGKPQSPSLSELQKQLNEKINGLKNGPKSGRQYSEELAQVAAEQERIRRALQEMQDKLKKEGGKAPGGDLPGKMEQTEMDLVNKQITEQTIRRQKEIETRLLETEKSMREQEMDQERKGESAKDYDKEVPKAFEEYLRLKEKEVELLKSVPPKFYPYYKKEVNEYFKRIRNH